MKRKARCIVHLFLFLMFLTLSLPSIETADPEQRTFISYSTGAKQVARDSEGRNSPYTKALLENIAKPGLTISDLFVNVRIREAL